MHLVRWWNIVRRLHGKTERQAQRRQALSTYGLRVLAPVAKPILTTPYAFAVHQLCPAGRETHTDHMNCYLVPELKPKLQVH